MCLRHDSELWRKAKAHAIKENNGYIYGYKIVRADGRPQFSYNNEFVWQYGWNEEEETRTTVLPNHAVSARGLYLYIKDPRGRHGSTHRRLNRSSLTLWKARVHVDDVRGYQGSNTFLLGQIMACKVQLLKRLAGCGVSKERKN